VLGVKAMATVLKVKLPGSSKRTDADIARSADSVRHLPSLRVREAQVFELVREGVLDSDGNGPARWMFSGTSQRTTRIALRLQGP